MRIASLILVLSCSATAQAQVGGTNVWGGTPRAFNFTPIDTSKAVGATNLSHAFRSPSTAANKPLNLSGLFPSITLPSWPPKTAHVTALPQSQNPFQPNGIKGGVNPFTPAKKK